MSLVEEIYTLTKFFPKNEVYGLSQQMQRAAVSIPPNIAEGYKRNHLPEYIQFLSIANGSGGELETQIELCKRLPELRSFDYAKAEGLLNEIMRMFTVLIDRLTSKRYTKPYTLSPIP